MYRTGGSRTWMKSWKPELANISGNSTCLGPSWGIPLCGQRDQGDYFTRNGDRQKELFLPNMIFLRTCPHHRPRPYSHGYFDSLHPGAQSTPPRALTDYDKRLNEARIKQDLQFPYGEPGTRHRRNHEPQLDYDYDPWEECDPCEGYRGNQDSLHPILSKLRFFPVDPPPMPICDPKGQKNRKGKKGRGKKNAKCYHLWNFSTKLESAEYALSLREQEAKLEILDELLKNPNANPDGPRKPRVKTFKNPPRCLSINLKSHFSSWYKYDPISKSRKMLLGPRPTPCSSRIKRKSEVKVAPTPHAFLHAKPHEAPSLAPVKVKRSKKLAQKAVEPKGSDFRRNYDDGGLWDAGLGYQRGRSPAVKNPHISDSASVFPLAKSQSKAIQIKVKYTGSSGKNDLSGHGKSDPNGHGKTDPNLHGKTDPQHPEQSDHFRIKLDDLVPNESFSDLEIRSDSDEDSRNDSYHQEHRRSDPKDPRQSDQNEHRYSHPQELRRSDPKQLRRSDPFDTRESIKETEMSDLSDQGWSDFSDHCRSNPTDHRKSDPTAHRKSDPTAHNHRRSDPTYHRRSNPADPRRSDLTDPRMSDRRTDHGIESEWDYENSFGCETDPSGIKPFYNQSENYSSLFHSSDSNDKHYYDLLYHEYLDNSSDAYQMYDPNDTLHPSYAHGSYFYDEEQQNVCQFQGSKQHDHPRKYHQYPNHKSQKQDCGCGHSSCDCLLHSVPNSKECDHMNHKNRGKCHSAGPTQRDPKSDCDPNDRHRHNHDKTHNHLHHPKGPHYSNYGNYGHKNDPEVIWDDGMIWDENEDQSDFCGNPETVAKLKNHALRQDAMLRNRKDNHPNSCGVEQPRDGYQRLSYPEGPKKGQRYPNYNCTEDEEMGGFIYENPNRVHRNGPPHPYDNTKNLEHQVILLPAVGGQKNHHPGRSDSRKMHYPGVSEEYGLCSIRSESHVPSRDDPNGQRRNYQGQRERSDPRGNDQSNTRLRDEWDPRRSNRMDPKHNHQNYPRQDHYSDPIHDHQSDPRQGHHSEPRQSHQNDPRQRNQSEPRQSDRSSSRQAYSRFPREDHQSDPRQGQQSDPRQGHQSDPRQGHQSDPRQGQHSDPRQGHQSDPRQGHHSDPRQSSQNDTGRSHKGDPRPNHHQRDSRQPHYTDQSQSSQTDPSQSSHYDRRQRNESEPGRYDRNNSQECYHSDPRQSHQNDPREKGHHTDHRPVHQTEPRKDHPSDPNQSNQKNAVRRHNTDPQQNHPLDSRQTHNTDPSQSSQYDPRERNQSQLKRSEWSNSQECNYSDPRQGHQGNPRHDHKSDPRQSHQKDPGGSHSRDPSPNHQRDFRQSQNPGPSQSSRTDQISRNQCKPKPSDRSISQYNHSDPRQGHLNDPRQGHLNDHRQGHQNELKNDHQTDHRHGHQTDPRQSHQNDPGRSHNRDPSQSSQTEPMPSNQDYTIQSYKVKQNNQNGHHQHESGNPNQPTIESISGTNRSATTDQSHLVEYRGHCGPNHPAMVPNRGLTKYQDAPSESSDWQLHKTCCTGTTPLDISTLSHDRPCVHQSPEMHDVDHLVISNHQNPNPVGQFQNHQHPRHRPDLRDNTKHLESTAGGHNHHHKVSDPRESKFRGALDPKMHYPGVSEGCAVGPIRNESKVHNRIEPNEYRRNQDGQCDPRPSHQNDPSRNQQIYPIQNHPNQSQQNRHHGHRQSPIASENNRHHRQPEVHVDNEVYSATCSGQLPSEWDEYSQIGQGTYHQRPQINDRGQLACPPHQEHHHNPVGTFQIHQHHHHNRPDPNYPKKC